MTKNIGENVSKNLMNKYIYVFYANTIEVNCIIMLAVLLIFSMILILLGLDLNKQ